MKRVCVQWEREGETSRKARLKEVSTINRNLLSKEYRNIAEEHIKVSNN